MTADHTSRIIATDAETSSHQQDRAGTHESHADHRHTHDKDAGPGPAHAAAVPTRPCPKGIKPESWAYWEPICAAMDPLTPEEIADVGAILRRADARRAARKRNEQ